MGNYAAIEDVTARSNIAIDANSKLTTATINGLIDSAEAQINSYLAKRYTVPATPNQLLKKLTVDLALYDCKPIIDFNLGDIAAQLIVTTHEQSIKTLEAIRDSNQDLPDNTPLTPAIKVSVDTSLATQGDVAW
jgi:phage gp36-like protein